MLRVTVTAKCTNIGGPVRDEHRPRTSSAPGTSSFPSSLGKDVTGSFIPTPFAACPAPGHYPRVTHSRRTGFSRPKGGLSGLRRSDSGVGRPEGRVWG